MNRTPLVRLTVGAAASIAMTLMLGIPGASGGTPPAGPSGVSEGRVATTADYTLATDINDAGWVVGTSWVVDPVHPLQRYRHAVVWLPGDGGIVDLGVFEPSLPDSVGQALDDQGRAVGQAVSGGFGSASFPQAALWRTGTAARIDLSGGHDSLANGINERGQVVGSTFSDTGGYGACLWRRRSHELLLLGTGLSSASAVNDHGQVVGWFTAGSGRRTAFRWESGTRRMVPLGGFDRRVTASVANDINNDGQVVGTYNDSKDRVHAFVWHPGNRSVTYLGGLFGRVAEATSISDDGIVVGSVQRPDGTWRAFRWDAATRHMAPLPNLASPSRATAINARGQVVGTYIDGRHAFLWRPRTQTVRDLPALVAPTAGP